MIFIIKFHFFTINIKTSSVCSLWLLAASRDVALLWAVRLCLQDGFTPQPSQILSLGASPVEHIAADAAGAQRPAPPRRSPCAWRPPPPPHTVPYPPRRRRPPPSLLRRRHRARVAARRAELRIRAGRPRRGGHRRRVLPPGAGPAGHRVRGSHLQAVGPRCRISRLPERGAGPPAARAARISAPRSAPAGAIPLSPTRRCSVPRR